LTNARAVWYYLSKMNRLNIKQQAQIVRCLIDGVSVRGTARITGASKVTVLKLLADIGTACAEYQDRVFHDLTCKKIQADEIWSFCYAKQKNVPEEKQDQFGYGDVWTFTAICADSKLIPSWHFGKRDTENATVFMKDLASRMKHRVQLTTDGHKMYLEAVEDAFGSEIDFSQLVKIYGVSEGETEKRYSPAKCLGTEKINMIGNPNKKDISTSYIERANLTMRMGIRRFTRLTNGFSKKFENHMHSVALHFMYYNFCRIHQTLRVTPAMEAGVTDRLWEIEDILQLLK
jgi:IS1 family transposase